MADADRPRRSRRRRWLFIAGGLLLGLLVVVALLPTLISAGLGQGLIRNAIDERINGSVAIDDMRFRWLGGQAIRGLKIVDPQGKQATDIDLQINSSLLSMLIKRPGPLDVAVSGKVRGEIRPDGSISLAELGAASSPGAPSATPASGTAEPFRLPELPEITLRLEKLAVVLNDLQSQQELALENTTGRLRFETYEGPISLNVSAQPRTADKRGRLEIKATADDLFDYNGRLKLREAVVELEVAAGDISLPGFAAARLGLPEAVELKTLEASLASDDMTKDVVASLDAQVQSAQWTQPGTIQAQVAASNVLGNRGEITPQGAVIHGSMTMQNVPVAAGDVNAMVAQLNATLASDDLSKTLNIGADGSTQVEGFEPSPLMARISIDQPFSAAGQFEFNLAKVTGTASGQTVPAAIVQPLLRNTAVVAVRDVGATLDVQASFGAGAAKDISLNVSGEKARLELTANVNPQTRAINGSHLLLISDAVHPELVRTLTNGAVASDAPFDLELRLTSFSYPPADDPAPLPKATVQGSLNMHGPATIRLGGADAAAGSGGAQREAFAIERLRAEFNSSGLGKQSNVNGSMSLDGAQVTFEEAITRLFDSQGKLAVAQALPKGSLRVQGLPATTIARFAPERKALLDALVGRAADISINTDEAQGNLRAAVNATATASRAELTVVREPNALRLEGGRIVASLSAELARALQPDADEPIVFARPSNLTIELQPATFPANPAGGFTLPEHEPVRAVVSVPSAEIANPPGLAQPVQMNDVAVELQLMREGDGTAVTAAGDAEVHAARDRALLTRARYSIKALQRNEQMTVQGDIGLTDLSMAMLERAMGKPDGTWSQWTGDSGHVTAHVESGPAQGVWTAQVRPALPNVTGDFSARSDGAMMALNASNGTLTVSRETLERRMNPAPESQAGADGEAAARVRVENDLPFTFSIEQMQVPVGTGGAGAASAQMKIRAASTGALALVNPDGSRSTLDQLTLAVDSPSLQQGVTFALKGQANSDAPSQPVVATDQNGRGGNGRGGQASAATTQPSGAGALDITGTVTNLVAEDQTIQPSNARLAMNAKFQDVPTAIVDAMTDLQGLLVAAVGGRMNATITATDFSANTGRLDADVRTTNGMLTTQLRGREGALRIPPNPPLTAELNVTPALRERLLMRIHPLLADIRTTKHPLRATVASGVLPMSKDGTGGAFDVSGLRADVEINIGPVEFESGSTTLALLRLFNEADRGTIPGEIEPIVAKIRNGVVRYDQFAVKLDKYTLRYSGEIDLVKQTVNLRTELPLEALATTFQELEGYADRIVVPLVTRGRIGELKTEIDPKFDIGKAALDAGLGGALDNILKERGSSLNDLLDQLNKPKPKAGKPK